MELTSFKQRLQEVLEFQRNKREEYFAGVLNNMPCEVFQEVTNVELDTISKEEVRKFGLSRINDLDRYPNPRDGHLTMDEVTEGIERAFDNRERAILIFIWLHFDEIRSSSKDFHGTESAFDYVLTAEDFLNYS